MEARFPPCLKGRSFQREDLMNSCFIILALGLALLQGCTAAIATGAVAGTATGVAVVYDRRSLGTTIDDQSIELQANAALRNNEALHKSSHITVTSYNGVVLLTGETPTKKLRAKAVELVKAIPDIRRIYNELGLVAPSSLMSRSHDAWITAKIKTKMTAKKDINPARIKVITERGTVYLLGLVTPQEADLAITIARYTEGVQRVVNAFELLPQTASE